MKHIQSERNPDDGHPKNLSERVESQRADCARLQFAAERKLS